MLAVQYKRPLTYDKTFFNFQIELFLFYHRDVYKRQAIYRVMWYSNDIPKKEVRKYVKR